MHDTEPRLLFLGLLHLQNIIRVDSVIILAPSQLVVAHVLFLVVKLAIAIRRCAFEEISFQKVVFSNILTSPILELVLLFQLKIFAIILEVVIL
jgi:hypothetical protein